MHPVCLFEARDRSDDERYACSRRSKRLSLMLIARHVAQAA
jgi:hypothetical protein